MSSPDASVGLGAQARAVAVLAAGVITRISRDRTALFFVVVLPLVIIVVIGATFFSAPGQLTVGVAGPETGSSAPVVAALEGSPAFSLQRFGDVGDLERAVRRRSLPAGLVFGDTDQAGATPVRLIADPASSSAHAVRQMVTGVLQHQGVVEAAATAVASRTAIEPERARSEARALATELPSTAVETMTVGAAPPPPPGQFTYPAASNLVLFVFVNSLAVGAALIRDRRLGVTRRILAGPVSPGVVLVGDGLGRLAFALLQAALIVVVGAVLFGVSWGDPLGAAALVVTFSVVATAAGLLLGVVVGSEDLAGSLAPPAGIALGMLGGTMWPLEVVPPLMRAVGRLTPHAWAMDAWIVLVFDRKGLGGIAVQLAVLAGFAAALAAVAIPLTRRRLTTTG